MSPLDSCHGEAQGWSKDIFLLSLLEHRGGPERFGYWSGWGSVAPSVVVVPRATNGLDAFRGSSLQGVAHRDRRWPAGRLRSWRFARKRALRVGNMASFPFPASVLAATPKREVTPRSGASGRDLKHRLRGQKRSQRRRTTAELRALSAFFRATFRLRNLRTGHGRSPSATS